MFLPQMAPMMWTNLMMLFTMMMITTITMMYFNYQIKKKTINKKNKTKTNWNW